MHNIESTFTFGTEVTFDGLTVMPLLGRSPRECEYDTLDEALARGTLRITEATDEGYVPEIKVVNHGPRAVLIIDGEELVGAKQNRTVNITILVPTGATVIVPVTCVEAGRWSARSHGFAAAPRTHFAAGRAAKSFQVSDSLLREGVARGDQAQVWAAIEEKAARLQAHSATSAMADIFDVQAHRIESYVESVPVVDNQVGAVFVLDGQPVGVDLLDNPRAFRMLMPKILRGYAVDAIDLRFTRGTVAPAAPSPALLRLRARRFMRKVLSAPRKAFPAIGLGETCRLYAPRVSGGALIVNGNLVHLSAFKS